MKEEKGTRLRRRAPWPRTVEKNLANDAGEGAPWKSARLAPLVANVLPGLPSTPGPQLTAEGVSDGGAVEHKVIPERPIQVRQTVIGNSEKAGAGTRTAVSDTMLNGGGE